MNTQKGFGLIGILITIVVVVGIVGSSILFLQKNPENKNRADTTIRQAKEVKREREDKSIVANESKIDSQPMCYQFVGSPTITLISKTDADMLIEDFQGKKVGKSIRAMWGTNYQEYFEPNVGNIDLVEIPFAPSGEYRVTIESNPTSAQNENVLLTASWDVSDFTVDKELEENESGQRTMFAPKKENKIVLIDSVPLKDVAGKTFTFELPLTCDNTLKCGLLISSFTPDSPAKNSGLKKGDFITGINNTPFTADTITNGIVTKENHEIILNTERGDFSVMPVYNPQAKKALTGIWYETFTDGCTQ